VLSLVVTPTIYDLGERLGPWFSKIPPARWLARSALREARTVDPVATDEPGEASAKAESKHGPAGGPPRAAIIAGFGIIGRAVADHLEVHNVPFTVVELNSKTVETQRKLGRKVVYGDIGHPEVLESAGIHDADTVFLTIPDDEATLRACEAIRRLAPHAYIVARTGYLSSAFAASASGADDVAVAEVALADAMAKKVLARLRRKV